MVSGIDKMIKLCDFTKCYSLKKTASPAVEKISLCAGKGITGILGLNGAGKTTIIKAILGEHYATSGKVLISDEQGIFFDAAQSPEKARLAIGYVPENSLLPENLFVSEYLSLVQNVYSAHKSSIEKQRLFEKTVKEWGLSDALGKKIAVLSKGFKQRVSFAAAFMYDPANIVLDEPVNGLDPAQIIQFRNSVREAGKTKTVVISTHLMQEVHSLCDTICIVVNGRSVFYGTEKELLDATKTECVEDAFLKITSEVNAVEIKRQDG